MTKDEYNKFYSTKPVSELIEKLRLHRIGSLILDKDWYEALKTHLSERDITNEERKIIDYILSADAATLSKEVSEEPSKIQNQQPKVKKNIGCGVLLLICALGMFTTFITNGIPGDVPYLLGYLAAFALMVYFGIRMIKGKKKRD